MWLGYHSEEDGRPTPVADVPIGLVPTTPRRHITGSLALNLPYVRRMSGDWHEGIWWDVKPTTLSTPYELTDEATYGRLLDCLGNSGLRDARPGLAELRHPGAKWPEKAWAADHDRAAIEMAWARLQDEEGAGLGPGRPPVDSYDFYRILPYPDQWLRVRWWAWRVASVLTKDELAIWNAWRKEWWP